jgi:GxxExxY protein
MTSLKITSTLPPELDLLIEQTIGALLVVHRELGSGMSEKVYAAAAHVELNERGIPFEAEKSYPVRYRGTLLCHQRVDLLIDQRLVIEIKSVDRLHAAHVAQVVSYLRLTGSRAGLLVNFNVALLKYGLRRIVL